MVRARLKLRCPRAGSHSAGEKRTKPFFPSVEETIRSPLFLPRILVTFLSLLYLKHAGLPLSPGAPPPTHPPTHHLRPTHPNPATPALAAKSLQPFKVTG